MTLPHVICPAPRKAGILCPSSVVAFDSASGPNGLKEITYDAVFPWAKQTLEILERALQFRHLVQLRLPIQGGYEYPLVRIRNYNYPLKGSRENNDIKAVFSYVRARG